MNNVLVTGGYGLLGSEIFFRSGVTFKPTKETLDITDYCALKRYVQQYNITRIIHCAALVGGVKANSTRNYDFFEQNLQMNMNVLQACKEFSLQNSVFLLSSCIMPSDIRTPYKESDLHKGEPHYTNYGYAYAKRMLEVGSRALKEQYDIATTCIIPCNLYGTNDNYNLDSGHVIPNLIHKCYLAKQNKTDFIVGGSGEPEREFMFATDLAKIITSSDLNSDVMIVSPGTAHKIKDIASMIADIMGFDGRIVYDRTYPDGILKKPTNNALFRYENPYFTFTPLENGLKTTIEYFVKNYDKVRK